MCSYWLNVKLSGNRTHGLAEEPERATFKSVKDELRRLAAHADRRVSTADGEAHPPAKPTDQLVPLLGSDAHYITTKQAAALAGWLDAVVPFVDEGDEKETGRFAALREVMTVVQARDRVLAVLGKRSPRLVYFSTYTRVRPLLHLGHLADAIDAGAVDPADPYHFGNYCLLKLLGFSARELSDLGKTTEPAPGDTEAFEAYRAKLDKRDAVLNAASLNLRHRGILEPLPTVRRLAARPTRDTL